MSYKKAVIIPVFFLALFGLSYAIAKLLAVFLPGVAKVLFLKKPYEKKAVSKTFS